VAEIRGRLTHQPGFVARDAEIAWLERCLQEAVAGRPQLVTIVGEPGVGKTRLMRELRARAAQARFEVCTGRGEAELAVPYRALATALEPVLASEGSSAPQCALARELLRGGEPAPSALDPSADLDRASRRAVLALQAEVLSLAERRPLLLALDDLQWFDRASVEFLVRLAGALSTPSPRAPRHLMMIATQRWVTPDDELSTSLGRLQREPITSVIELGGLDPRGVGRLLTSLGVRQPSAQLVEAISDLTRGNPLFVQEIYLYLRRHGIVSEYGELPDAARLEVLELPANVVDAVASRRQSLSPETAELVTLAACLGLRFSLERLAAVSGLERGKLLDRLEEAAAAHVLEAGEQTLEFTHPLVRHAFYAGAGDFHRRRLHLGIADRLERSAAGAEDRSDVEIAQHLVRAGPLADRERRAVFGRRAGDRALAASAFGDAARFYGTALEARGPQASASERAELHYLAGLARYRDSDGRRAVEEFERAAAAYEEAGDALGAGLAHLERTRVQITLDPLPYGTLADVAPLEKALALCGDQDATRGRILSLLSGVHWTARQPEAAVRRAAEALQVGLRLEDDALCCEASSALSLAQTQVLDLHEAAESCRGAVDFARRADAPWLESNTLSRLPLLQVWLGELDQAELAVREAEALGRRIQDWSSLSLALAARVSREVARGSFSAAERWYEEVLRMAERSAYPWGAFNAVPAIACSHVARGDPGAADAALARMVEPGALFPEPGPTIQLLAWIYRQVVALHSGTDPALRERLAATLADVEPEPRPEIGAIGGYCATIEIADELGDPALAAATEGAVASAYERGVLFSSGWVFLIPRMLAVAARLRGDFDLAQKRLEAATELATRAGARAELGRCYLDRAHLLETRGRASEQAEAAAAARRALAIFALLDMRPFARRSETLIERLPRCDGGPPAIGGRERELLGRIARGAAPAKSVAGAGLETGRFVRELLERVEAAEPDDRADEPLARTVTAPAEAVGSGAPGCVPLVVLITDMVGSTELLDRLGQHEALERMGDHNHILRACLAEAGGTEIQHTGDGLFATFLSAERAVRCAIAMQKALARHNADSGSEPIQVRMGLAAGEVLPVEGRLFGTPVNGAVRVGRPGRDRGDRPSASAGLGRGLHLSRPG